MWAEKLYDGSFEGLSPYKFAFIQQSDFKEKPWGPSGAVNRGQYSLDKTTKVSGEVSQKIIAEGPEPNRLGLSQDGIALERGKACVLTCWLRSTGLREAVRIRLHKEGVVYAEGLLTPGPEWGKFQARLKPNTTEADATLTIDFKGPGTLWLDNASLMPVDTVGGWRKDVVEAVRSVKPRIIRFGGSALDEPGFGEFEWKDTIGNPDTRKPFRAWGGLQPTGPGLEEFVQFCRAVEAEPMICVRFTGRTPQQAAEQVQYFNGGPQTPMGALRARNGHREPYGIRYWQVGNERQSQEYDEKVVAFCEAMKKADPRISILGSFPTAGSLRNAGAHLDYICPHHYTPDLAECESNLSSLRQLLAENAPRQNIKVGVTEWNTTAGDWGLRRAMLMTLANGLACARYQHLLHRNCDLVEIANRSNLINSFGSGFLQVDNHRLYKTPAYYAQWLYANLAGNRPLKLDASVPVNVGVDLSATLDTKTGQLTLFAVNESLEPAVRKLDFSAFKMRGQQITVWTLADRENAGEPDVRNSFAAPERIALKKNQFRSRSPEFEHQFPPLSLTVLQLSTAP
jgi:alpha-L-arabinofuranosidase